jgi:ParB family chromosome partitioning protein
MRRDTVTDEDLAGLLGNFETYSARTREVLGERIAQPMPGHLIEVPIELLDPDPRQPRKSFPEATLRDLADSIREQGVLQPLVIRPRDDQSGRYWIVAGERRFRASRLAGIGTVPCVLRLYSDEQSLVVALVENVHRDDLTDIEKSDALRGLKELTGKTWDDLARSVNLSPDRVRSLAMLQRLAEPVKEQVRAGVLSGRKALAVLPLPPSEQVHVANDAAVNGWNAEQLRERVQRLLPDRKPRRSPARDSARSSTLAAPAETEEHVTRNMLRSSPPPPSGRPAGHVPHAVQRLREQLADATTLLRSTGAGILDPETRRALHAELSGLQALLAEVEPEGTPSTLSETSNDDAI